MKHPPGALASPAEFVSAGLFSLSLKAKCLRAYPKIPLRRRKIPGECFNAGIFQAMELILGYALKPLVFTPNPKCDMIIGNRVQIGCILLKLQQAIMKRSKTFVLAIRKGSFYGSA
ncbi:MAG: hypothetical protein LBC41_11185 [Clostridiales bacterium]|nr:hypothetical protein [Clostridiales bacterium]